MSVTLEEKPPSEGNPISRETWIYGGMYAALTVVGIGILCLTVTNFLPILDSSRVAAVEEDRLTLPGVEVAAFHALPSQHVGRYKPFETACLESMRQITGKNKWQKKDSVAVVLSWMLDRDPDNPRAPASQWEETEFILCDHQDLRKLIFTIQADGTKSDPDRLSHDQIHGKYASPKQLRVFKTRMETLERKNAGLYKELIEPLSRHAEEVLFGRLALYDSIRLGIIETNGEMEKRMPRDPFAFVSLDKVPGSPWFSIGELRFFFEDAVEVEKVVDGKKVKQWESKRWSMLMRERVIKAPQLYLSKEHQDAQEEFKLSVKNGKRPQEWWTN